MKKSILLNIKLACLFVATLVCHNLQAQTPGDDYQGRLYRLCKTWGYVKYYHSAVSNCQLNWDSVLVATIPQVKAANNSADFNRAVLTMLYAAGRMDSATTAPAVLDSNAFNVDTTWLSDAYFSDSIRLLLKNIQHNFRPHTMCRIVDNDYSNPNIFSFLQFPGDDGFSANIPVFPDEPLRLQMLFRYWNTLSYFNPNSKTLDTRWDTALLNSVLPFANAANQPDLYKAYLRLMAKLNDTHAQGFSYSNSLFFAGGYFPSFDLTYMENSYVVTVSHDINIPVGTVVDSIDNLTMPQWEDSLRNYISASNLSVFRRDDIPMIIAGNYNTYLQVAFHDSTGQKSSAASHRTNNVQAWYNIIHYANTDFTTKYKTLGCDIGYVNMGNLLIDDVYEMWNALKDKEAIIFDLRNYPNGTVLLLDSLMFPRLQHVATFLEPDVTYPGNFTPFDDYLGPYDQLGHGLINPAPYLGQVIILMNEQTQSQAEFTCMNLEANAHVLKVGSQTAGADGDISQFKISSDLNAGYTSLGIYYPNGVNAQRIGIVPDVKISPTISGFRAGKDEVLDTALVLACPTAIRQLEQGGNFRLFPNPASSSINIENASGNQRVQVRITNILGQPVQEVAMAGTVQSIDISSLTQGMYLVNIFDEHGALLKTIKWVKD